MRKAKLWEANLLEHLTMVQAFHTERVLVRYHGKTISVHCKPSCPVKEFEALWQDKVGIPPPPGFAKAVLREYARQNGTLRLFLD